MAIEIERKFLVLREYLPKLEDGEKIIQGYLSVNPLIRFRILGNKIILNIKKELPDGTRFEFETNNTTCLLEECQTIKSMSIYPCIEKIRYRVPFENLIWEIDVYQGENKELITADVELPSLDFPIIFPKWINSNMEITNDSKYFNSNLGRFPFSKWNK